MGCHCSSGPVAGGFRASPGQDIRDDYRIGKLLGSGAFGQVRECTRRSNGELLAVKIMERKSNEVGHWSNENMFRREVELLGILDSPCIVKYFDFYEDKHFLYVVMEMCEGGELFEQIVKCKRFNERDASYVCRQILTAVAYVHSLGIVHRDIKAENFMFKYKDIDSELKLIDFGMSARLSPPLKTFLTEMCGSPHYLSPELIKRRYDRQADMWAIGVLIYLMLYGRYPFDGSSTDQIVKRILTQPIEYTTGTAAISAEAIDFLQKLLERDPAKRLTAREALTHKWVGDTEEHQRRRERAAALKEDQSPNLIDVVRSAHRKVTAHRMSAASQKLDARRNRLLGRLEKDWERGRPLGSVRISPLNCPPHTKPEFSRRGTRVNTTPSRYLAAKRSDVQALCLAVEAEASTSSAADGYPGADDIASADMSQGTPGQPLFNDGWTAVTPEKYDEDGSKADLLAAARRRTFTVHVNQKDVVEACKAAVKCEMGVT